MSRRLLLEADGGSRGNPGPAAFGAVVRDAATGEVLAERGECIGVATNNVAEYRGLIAALEAAFELDPSAEVEARLDSKLVVEQMSGRWKIKHPDMRPLAMQASRIYPAQQVTYTWVPRELNKHADRLANEALDGNPTYFGASASGATISAGPASADPVAGDQLAFVDEAEVEPPAPEVLRGFSDAAKVPTACTLHLVRHGHTDMTLAKKFSGRGGEDPPLSERGFTEARAAGGYLRDSIEAQAIIASPLLRTRQTAEAIGEVLQLPVEVDDGFAECAFGKWDGFTFAEVQQQWPDVLQSWLGDTSVAPPGGESFEQHKVRVLEARDRLAGRYPDGSVIVVTHVSPIKQLVRAALDAPMKAMFRMELAPASVTTLQWWSDGGASMRMFNSTSHLASLDPR